jgi:two-component system, cell cycle sensor histidine kinase and response regulator CckA
MAVEAAQLGTWHWDIERNSITMTAGMPPLGPAGKKVATLADFIQTVLPEDRKLVEDRIQRAVEDGKDFNAEFRVTRDDGMRWMAVRGQVIRDNNGRIIALTGVDMDITDRKEAEEERHRLEAQIQHTQKLESLGVLAGGIAHDFNNLLAAMLGNASLALLELPPESPALKSIQNIQTASQRAAELCRQMLAYSGKGKFVVEAINLNRLVEEMGHLLQACISKNVSLKYNFAPELPFFYADATQVRQVIMNMITNASEAIDQRPGNITVSTGIIDATEQYLATCYPAEQPPPGRYLYADVCDDGCGMTPETLARIFDPFFSTKFTGRGLGLAAVLGIMRGHRGTMKVTSAPDKGTCFRALFPCVANARPRPTTTHVPVAEWRGSGTVLVVDDEECIRTVAQNILQAFGFQVLSACDGEESIAVLRDNKDTVSAVLLDMTMPRMDGETAFQKLRAIRPDLRIILSSGFTEQEVAARFADKPVAGFVQKPYTASDLIQKLRAALSSN